MYLGHTVLQYEGEYISHQVGNIPVGSSMPRCVPLNYQLYNCELIQQARQRSLPYYYSERRKASEIGPSEKHF
jgi:hypothetical protein